MNIQAINYQMNSCNQMNFKQIHLAPDFHVTDGVYSRLTRELNTCVIGGAEKKEIFNKISSTPYVYQFGAKGVTLFTQLGEKIAEKPYGKNVWGTLEELHKLSVAHKIEEDDKYAEAIADSIQV